MDRSRWMLLAALVAALLAAVLATAESGRSAQTPPLIGTNYTHFANPDCSLANTGIITHYQDRGIRRLVRAQLAAMHNAGAESLRLLLWFLTDASDENWGPVSSGSGKIEEPYRSNLIRYLSDVRKAGFKQLTLSFSPEYHNLPLDPAYDPSTFAENWSFIRNVVPLAEKYGPASTRIDLSNEEPAGMYDSSTAVADTKAYVTRLWSKYEPMFGNDATFSVIGGDGPSDASARLQNLIDALQATGKPLPAWFDIHPPYTYNGTLSVLQAVDQTLTADHLSQPLVIGEEAYNDASTAQAILDFMNHSSRRVLEVMEWPLTADRPCQNISVSAPYRVDNYLTTLTGRPAPPPTPNPLPLPRIPTLVGTVGPGGITFTTAAGRRVRTLDSGQYTIVVRDRSTTEDFHLSGPDISKHTGVRFRGTVVWHVDIGRTVPYGRPYAFFSDQHPAKLRGTFTIT